MERKTKHLWERVILKLGLVPKFREEMERESFLNTTGTSPTLGGIALGNPCLDKLGDLSLFVEAHLTVLTAVDLMKSEWRSAEFMYN